ncbi:MAG: 1-acyl-sn-glycerol-3-phosphate acyltransferase [Cyanobacteria bacterium SZAS LIN-5]|nr:1-acyl-sn-glycerol-3-phosphate acyltransferase [Cyanobacteria bacterium SZAS LIN-5]
MNKFLSVLFSIYFFASCAVLYSVCAMICLLTAPFDPLRKACHAFSCWWGYHYFQLNPFWKLSYEGVDNIRPDKTYVLIANHQSLADILVIYGLHRRFKWVSKESIFKVPFVGWNMGLNQDVLLRRGDIKSIREMMDVCRTWLKKGCSIALFPEGTRSEDGEIHAFRDGAFRLAMDCGVQVVPIVIDGTFDLLPKGSTTLNFRKHIRIKVLPPVDASAFKGSSGDMRTAVREQMIAALAEMRKQTTTIAEPAPVL